MGLVNCYVTCENSHVHEVFLDRGVDGRPVYVGCETCGEPTSRVYGGLSAGSLDAWTDVEGVDPDTGKPVQLKNEGDRRELEARWRKMAGDRGGDLITLSQTERRQMAQEARHQRAIAVREMNMPVRPD